MKLIRLFLLAALTAFCAQPDDSKQVLAAMDSLRDALVHRDGAALDRLLDPNLSYVHSNGALETKDKVVSANTTGTSVIEKIEYTGSTVRVFGDTALVRGRVDLWHSATNKVPMDVLHVWRRVDGQWKLIARQATRLEK